MAQEVLSAPFSMNLGKAAVDFKIEEVLFPDKALAFYRITYPSYQYSSEIPKHLAIFSTPAEPLRHSLRTDTTRLLDSAKSVSDFLGIFNMKGLKAQTQTCILYVAELCEAYCC